MGRVVTYVQAPAEKVADGVEMAPITIGDTREMAADFIRIAPGKRWGSTAPRGSDCYLFMLNGTGVIAAAGRQRFPAQAFATIEEGVEFAIENDGGADAEIIRVVAPPAPKPPQPSSPGRAGFRGAVMVAQRSERPVVHIPDQRKKRIYFVGDQAAKSERGHAMIVVYDQDTITALHHHPDAESMFVVLDGALAFTVNGAPAVVGPGQAAYFGIDDRHGLTTAKGCAGASFLEFHVPAAFTTVKA